MNILIFDLIKTPDEVAPHAEGHSKWVKQYLSEGVFVAAGPKKNKLGGVILAKSIDKKKLLAILAQDPYIIEELADCRVIDMDCKLAIDGLEILKTL